MSCPVVLIPGAGGMSWYWHIVEGDLRARGFDAVAVDLPAADESKGLPAYADAVIEAIGERPAVALVAQSLGGFTAPMVWQQVSTHLVTFVNAMIPLPGETPGGWWGNVGSEEARIAAAVSRGYSTEFDLEILFMHDIPDELQAMMRSREAPQSRAPFGDRCDFESWPEVPIHVIAARDDRFFPLALQRRVARERLGLEAEIVSGGHLAALSHPAEVSAAITSQLAAL